MNQVCVWQRLTCDRTLSGPQSAGTFEIELCRVTSLSAISEYLGPVRLEPSSNGSPFISVPVCTNLGGEAALWEGLDMISSSTIAVNIDCSISSVAVQTDALEVELRSF